MSECTPHWHGTLPTLFVSHDKFNSMGWNCKSSGETQNLGPYPLVLRFTRFFLG